MNPNLVLVQPKKTRPFKTERLLMGRKESNQTKIKLFIFKLNTSFLTSATDIHSVSFIIGFYDQIREIPHQSVSFDLTDKTLN